MFRGSNNNQPPLKLAPTQDFSAAPCPHEKRLDQIEQRLGILDRYAANATKLLWLIVATALSTFGLMILGLLGLT